MTKIILYIVSYLFLIAANAQKNLVNYWLTKPDQSALLKKYSVELKYGKSNNVYPIIKIDETNQFQTIDGFGYTLTGGSAYLINKMNTVAQASLLKELFGLNGYSIGISYLRISIGASDLSRSLFSYNDLANGEIDTSLAKFSLSQDTTDLLPLLKKILTINPNIKIMGTPWSPPVWMKNNQSSIGGSLLPQYYGVYAKYIVKYLKEMQLNGIKIDAITIQNEPQHGGNNPSMLMSAAQQAEFIKFHLGPIFKAYKISTKIIIYDHNCDNPNYPISILNDSLANQYIDGTAFHLYNGNINALSIVRDIHPSKAIYFTEQWTGKNGTFEGDFKWHIKNVIIGAMQNHSKVALEWNLANDSSYGPHTLGGCTECKGALTISGSNVTRNVAYYIIAHASKFVPTGSIRIHSSLVNDLCSVAFITPTGKTVLIVMNTGNQQQLFNIQIGKRWLSSKLSSGDVSSFVI